MRLSASFLLVQFSQQPQKQELLLLEGERKEGDEKRGEFLVSQKSGYFH